SNRCPPPTPFGPRLGSGLPWADEPSSGILRPTAEGILTPLIATHTGILASALSTAPYGTASAMAERSPTMHTPCASAASVPGLAPLHFRRRIARPVSYYALFKCMAASKPTSWLSWRPHILFHSAGAWGP